MKVIAKTDGPKYNGSGFGCLTIGKEYEVIAIHDPRFVDPAKRRCPPPDFNPIQTTFYLYVIDDNGREHAIWNDYFYPTEIEWKRERKLNQLGII